MADSPSLANNKIILTSLSPQQYDEKLVGVSQTIYPGMFVKFASFPLGSGVKLYPMASEYVSAPKQIAIENVYGGKTIYDPYYENELAYLYALLPGNIVLTKVMQLLGSSLDVGMVLCPDTGTSSGWLREWNVGSPGTEPTPVAISLEYDASPSFPRWTKVQIM